MATSTNSASTRAVQLWLRYICILILLMIAVGGITRLTLSGLSIVEWKPIMGAIPPITETQWSEAFEQYKQFPQYSQMFPNMTLDGFKYIYFWEWFHRLLGRLMGISYLLPWIVLTLRKKIPRCYQKRIAIGFVLGGAQGLLGWLMVMSGLVDRPSVSHYRLAAHFMLALTILGYLYHLNLKIGAEADESAHTHSEKVTATTRKYLLQGSTLLLVLLAIQMTWGAFVAGLKAGGIYPTFPTMNGQWIPTGLMAMRPLWLNFVDSVIGVHFTHRLLGWTLLISTTVFIWVGHRRLRQPLAAQAQRHLRAIGIVIWLQFALGALTVLTHVAIPVAVIHQVGAAFVLLALIRLRFFIQTMRTT